MAQVNDNDDIKWLYGKLKAKGYNIGSEAEFKSSLANGEDRKWYYEKAKGMGLDMAAWPTSRVCMHQRRHRHPRGNPHLLDSGSQPQPFRHPRNSQSRSRRSRL